MKKISYLLILTSMLSSTAWAACRPPDSPRKFPDGKTATKEQMQNAQKVFADFDKKIESYRACLKDDHDAVLKKNSKGDDALREELFKGYKEKDDRAMNEAEKAKNDLNQEIQAYNVASRARKAAGN
ncbi:MAG: hypothetical protein ABI645_08490 [Pseudomonadota bacterium]